MIGKAVELLKDYIYEYLSNIPELSNENGIKVELSHLNDHNNGQLKKDVVYLTVVNIEEERFAKSQAASSLSSSGSITYKNPDVKLNVFLLISSNFADYKDGLQALSASIQSFQVKNVFNHSNTPNLNAGIKKLVIEMHSLNFEEQHHLWRSLGIDYLPSVLYKMRVIKIQENVLSKEMPPIKSIHIDSGKV